MRSVRFTGSGFNFVALGVGGGVEAKGPQGLRVNGGPVIETADFLRATAVKRINRGNNRWSAQFTVWREHNSLAAAQDYLLSHPGELPVAENLVCLITLNSGANRYLTTPFIEIVDSSHTGVTTSHTYRLLGGSLVSQNPNT